MPTFPYTQALLRPHSGLSTASEGGKLVGLFGPPMPSLYLTYRAARQNKDATKRAKKKLIYPEFKLPICLTITWTKYTFEQNFFFLPTKRVLDKKSATRFRPQGLNNTPLSREVFTTLTKPVCVSVCTCEGVSVRAPRGDNSRVSV